MDGSQISTQPRFGGPSKSKGSRLSHIGANTGNISVSVSQEVHTTRDASRKHKQVHIPMVDMDDGTEVDVHTEDLVSCCHVPRLLVRSRIDVVSGRNINLKHHRWTIYPPVLSTASTKVHSSYNLCCDRSPPLLALIARVHLYHLDCGHDTTAKAPNSSPPAMHFASSYCLTTSRPFIAVLRVSGISPSLLAMVMLCVVYQGFLSPFWAVGWNRCWCKFT